MMVADTGPVIAFARLGWRDLLRQGVEALVITIGITRLP